MLYGSIVSLLKRQYMTKYLQLNDIDCYKRALKLSNYVWDIVIAWEWFEKSAVGIQFVKAIDSISANIAEGFGRYGKKDKINFYHYSFGSVKESCDWNEKSKIRHLLTPEQYNHVLYNLQTLSKEINQLILYTREKLKK